jgi:hypothetical protein
MNPLWNPLSNEDKPVACTGNTTKVSSAEKCTLDTARILGIEDPKQYFKTPYNSIKTFNPDIDSKDSQRFNQLCYNSLVKPSESYMNCIIEHGMGYKRKIGQPNKCITAECPTGFETTPEGCKKIPIPQTVVKSSRCDERWYDWFTIPNYHLGNKYQPYDGKCMDPCKPNYIPGYVKDPVDETTLDFSTKEDLNTCVHKYNYFGGKYRDTNDYCPIAIIKQLGNSKQDLIDEYVKALEKIPNANEHRQGIESTIPTIMESIHKTIHQNITEPDMPTGEYLNACRKLHTEERLADTYSICKNLMENPDTYTDKFLKDGSSTDDASTKTNLLKKACHAVFCNKNDDASAIVSEKIWPEGSCKEDDPNCPNRLSGEPLCFKEVENMNIEKDVQKLKQPQTELPIVSADKDKYKLNSSFKWMIYFIIVPVMAVIAYGVWTQLLWPYFFQPLWRFISRTIQYIITGFKASRRQDVIEDQIQQLRDIQPPKRNIAKELSTLRRR